MSIAVIRARKAEYDLREEEHLMKVLESFHVIYIDDLDFSEKLTWCLKHCQNKFRDLAHSGGQRAWYFENEQDATMFAMKWA